MKKGLFISATSTGIGKTVISALICKTLAEEGYKVAYYKPVQTGAINSENRELISPDCRFVAKVMEDFPAFQTFSTYRLKEPVSPHFAARIENTKLELETINRDFQKLQSFDFIIVEGAGGVYVPLADEGAFMADLPQKMGINVLLVSNGGLGAINHVGLTSFYLKSRGIGVSSILLLSWLETPNEIELENLSILKKLTHSSSIFLIPRIRKVNVDENIPGEINVNPDNFPDASKIIAWIRSSD